MKKAKLLSLFLAGSLLFQTAGIDAMATAPSEPAPVSETAEDADSLLSDQQPSEENPPIQSSEEKKKDNDSNAGEVDPQLPTEEEKEKDTDPAVEEKAPDQSGDEENTEKDSATEEEEGSDSISENTVPENIVSDNTIPESTISENTISENTLPAENETNIFSIFPGLGDSYQFSSQELADKRVLAAHVDDIVQVQSTETATIEDYRDTDGEYAPGEIVYLAETQEEAKQVAEAFGGTLDSYAHEVAVIELPQKATVSLAVAAAAKPDIKLPAVWPNYYQYLYDDTDVTVNSLTPSDPGFSRQWQHDYIGTRYAWAAGFKGQGVKIAVIDTGLAENHEDLTNNVITGKNFVDNAAGTPHTTDNQSHGTHVAGIIAADDNGKGGIGIAPDAKVSGYCVFPTGENSGAEIADVKRAINAAVSDGYDIINLSLGGANYDNDYEKIIKNACEKGVAVFAAAGNDDADCNNFPAAFSSAISVGAVNENSSRASFSNYGSTVDLSFPGAAIYSTIPSGYGISSGTSQACPAAAGTAAVILSAREDIRSKRGKARVDALLSAMKSSTTKCTDPGMGAGTTYLPDALKLATEMAAPEAPVIEVVNESDYQRGTNRKDYVADSVTVTLSTETAMGVNIYYATNGQTPSYKDGVITNADKSTPYVLGTPIQLTGAKSVTIKAIAVNPFSGKVSKAASKTVTLTPIPSSVTVTSTDRVKKIAAGKSLKLTAAVTPSYAISNKVAWSVDANASAAGITVSNGTVKTAGRTAPGEYTVTATAVGSNGKSFNGQTGTFQFTVIDKTTVAKVAFIDPATKKAPKTKSIKKGETLNLSDSLQVTKIDPSTKAQTTLTGTAALAEVVWSSNNEKVATVSEDTGVITAEGPGKAVVKATSNDGGNKSASYTLTVLQPVTSIIISDPLQKNLVGSDANVSNLSQIAAGKGITLTAKVTPANASNKKVSWSISGNGSAVSIGKNNGKITTKSGASGTYTVKATATDGSGVSSADYKITVVSGEITKIALSANKLTLFPPRTSAADSATTAALTPTIDTKGGNAALSKTLIVWTSSNSSAASVDQTGKITAKAPGKTTITCAAIDGSNKKATCTVNVTVPMSKLVIGPTNGNTGFVAVGKKIKMAAKYYSNYGTPTNKKIEWNIVERSGNAPASKVTIDKNGTVSVAKDAAPGGSVRVQATAQDGSGVTSNIYTLTVSPNYIAAQIAYRPVSRTSCSGHFYIVATAYRTNGGKPDWTKAEVLSDYCTASISGPKNSGLKKTRMQSGGSYYALYQPVPTNYTSLRLDDDPNALKQLKAGDLAKITLTVKLKDGSNLTAKANNIYAIRYPKGTGTAVAYLELKRK